MPQGGRPQYRVLVEKDVPMQTRDGVTLRADVYRPDAAGRFPVLLSRLPYNKNLRPRPGDIDYFVERGYGVIMQDTRGRFASEGEEYDALIWEMPDGYDADRKITRLNSSHLVISYAVFCLKKKKQVMINSHIRI